MRIEGLLIEGRLIRRLNRFAVEARVEGKVERCLFPNPSRLEELLQPGARLLLRDAGRRGGKTRLDVLGIYDGEELVGIDSRLPPQVFAEAVEEGRLLEFQGYRVVEREVRWGRSRIDLMLEGPRGPALVETKSCSLVIGGLAHFPDVPTERGRRHLKALQEAVSRGLEAYVVWVVQRQARGLRPYREVDPHFAEELTTAIRAGVKPLAYLAPLKDKTITIVGRIPVVEVKPPSHRKNPLG